MSGFGEDSDLLFLPSMETDDFSDSKLPLMLQFLFLSLLGWLQLVYKGELLGEASPGRQTSLTAPPSALPSMWPPAPQFWQQYSRAGSGLLNQEGCERQASWGRVLNLGPLWCSKPPKLPVHI